MKSEFPYFKFEVLNSQLNMH